MSKCWCRSVGVDAVVLVLMMKCWCLFISIGVDAVVLVLVLM